MDRISIWSFFSFNIIIIFVKNGIILSFKLRPNLLKFTFLLNIYRNIFKQTLKSMWNM